MTPEEIRNWTFRWAHTGRTFLDNSALAEAALRVSLTDGLFCEFGVYRGQSTRFIAQRIMPRVLHAFDSFKGLPAQPPELTRPNWSGGSFAVDKIPSFKEPNIALHIGWFEDTVAAWAASTPGHASFLYCDADLYSSTKTVLDAMRKKLTRGTVIMFDEMLYWDGWETKGEARAWAEFVEATGVSFDCIGTVAGGEQVAIRIN